MFGFRIFRFRSLERDRTTDERRVALIQKVVLFAVAEAEGEAKRLRVRISKVRSSAIFLVEQVDDHEPDPIYDGKEIMTCEEAGITVMLPKPMTSGAKAAGRFGKQDFVYVAADDVYRCPAGERLTYRHQSEEIRRYSTSTCKTCALKAQCTTGPERRISRWEHEAVLEKVQDRLDHNPDAMGVRRQTAEHPFGTIKCWMGATHFLTKKLPKVATEMALNVLAYNMKRVMAIAGVGGLLEAMQA
jgi:hypothetical protein